MAIGMVDRDIEDNGVVTTYNFEQFNTTLALKTLTRLTRLIGEPLAIALGGATDSKDQKTKVAGREVSGAVLGQAVKALIDRLDEKEVLDLFKLLTAEKVLCNEGKIIFDDHYRGRFTLLFKVFQTALEVQYGNFMGAVGVKSAVDIPPGGLTAR